jgi:hypothetical protein
MTTIDLQKLADQVGAGDAHAAATLRRQLEPQVRHMVRRTLRVGRPTSAVAAAILREAARVTPTSWDSPDRMAEQVTAEVARRVCAALVEQVLARRGSHGPAEALAG